MILMGFVEFGDPLETNSGVSWVFRDHCTKIAVWMAELFFGGLGVDIVPGCDAGCV